ncbi:hypothetical protein CAPTEDRAFT_144246 [Capitella teleta]|uniref:RING finger and CHY zinc finger domain-containing protein 1 n=1 Tax=Capitella teleta TaxID=283909 RepID=R7V856_CAPTE|nr:hypothetical protein CAPTEDRAFT_144246 [Capitella teleta]|eukprot:ELU11950.1 hypothetical protein CAPTEDRAFT_144246 [Capitella teleta]
MSDGKKSFGCSHYKRKCAFVSPCCKKIYTCRLCHDDKEMHEIDRRCVKEVVCLVCDTKQPASEDCKQCKTRFGAYHCSICNLYDDDNKRQFHCDPCGICRVGGRDNFYHCPKCDICLSTYLRDSHTCVEKVSRANCPVCLEDLHTSLMPSHIPKCGHLLHKNCFEQLLKSGNYTCPLCAQSMLPMQKAWESMDHEIEGTPMPDEYKDFHVQILCKDCHTESRVLFHVLGLKCHQCGSYNTCRTAAPEGLTEKGSGATPSGNGAASDD